MIDDKLTYEQLKIKIKELEEDLKKAKSERTVKPDNFFETLFTHSFSIKLITEFETGKIIDANIAATKFYGYSHDELVNMNIWQINTFSREEIKQAMLHVKTDKRNHFYFKHKLKNGDIRDVEVYGGKILLHHKEHLYSIVHDVTKQKQDEIELIKVKEKAEENAERYKRIIDCITDYLYTVTVKDGKAIETRHNEACIGVTGYSKNEFESDPYLWINMVVPEERPLVAGSFLKLLEGKDLCSIEHRIIHKNGNIRWVNNTLIPKYDPNGKLISYDGIIKDITERKQATEIIEKERTVLQTLIDNLPSAVFVKDKNYRKIIANKLHLSSMAAHLSVLGLDPHTEIIGKTDFEITANELAEKYFLDDQKVIRDGQLIINKEEEGFGPDGNRIWLLVSKIPLRGKDGIIDGMVAITTDITEIKNAEWLLTEKTNLIETQNEEFQQINEELNQTNQELIYAKEKAEESNRLKTAFLQNISHEIRTPMNSIMGFAELLKNADLSGEKQKEFIQFIEQGCRRMLNIINDIVDISKIESGQIEISFKEINVNHLLKQLYSSFKPEVERIGLKFDYYTEFSDESATTVTDETKLAQILSNLLNNSLKFTKAGNINFGYYLKKNMLEFYVQDTGKGIADNQIDIIFERFVQAEMSSTRNFEGAGLGLSISKAYVEKLGGKIWVESELGKGSTFFFSIPHKLATPGSIVTSATNILKNSLQSVNILITEDDKSSLLLMKEILENEKANLLFANNGQEAYDLVKIHSEIQIVIMDLKMPLMDGFQATKLIKNLRPNLPIIAQSAYAFSDDMHKALKAGCDDFISKPIRKEQLLSIINKQLSGHYKP